MFNINNIVNVEPEPEHPVKCKLPIAVELVRIRIAAGIKLVLLDVALIFRWLRSLQVGAAILHIAYNLRLRRMIILDVGAIATRINLVNSRIAEKLTKY